MLLMKLDQDQLADLFAAFCSSLSCLAVNYEDICKLEIHVCREFALFFYIFNPDVSPMENLHQPFAVTLVQSRLTDRRPIGFTWI